MDREWRHDQPVLKVLCEKAMGNEHFAKVPLKQDLQRSGLESICQPLRFGDIGVLATSEQNGFSVLDLSFTQVMGNIWVFQNAWHLRELYLGGMAWAQVLGAKSRADQLILNDFYILLIDLIGTAQIRSLQSVGVQVARFGFQVSNLRSHPFRFELAPPDPTV